MRTAGDEGTVHAGGLAWNVARAGEADDPPVLLLHGFPEHWRSWRRQIPAFAGAGMRVYAADMPGYGDTDAPDDYSLPALADLVAGLARELGDGSVHLVGHDWGGMVALAVAALHPDSVRSLVAASAPHLDALGNVFKRPQQIAKSWYVVAFQIPFIEYLLGTSFFVDRVFGGASAGVHDRAGMTRAVAYYRANLAPWQLGRNRLGRIEVPGLVIHGSRDRYITEALMSATAEMFDDLHGFHELDAGHYVQRATPDEFNRVVIGFWRSIGALPPA